MVPDHHREELVLLLLSRLEGPLDADSIAATYDTPVDGWAETLAALEADGYVEQVEDGLYALTAKGETATVTRGSNRDGVRHSGVS